MEDHRPDLTAASVAYLLEPQWNPMMEEQELCCIHRLGQKEDYLLPNPRLLRRGSCQTFPKLVFMRGLLIFSVYGTDVPIASRASTRTQERNTAEAFSAKGRKNLLDDANRLQVSFIART